MYIRFLHTIFRSTFNRFSTNASSRTYQNGSLLMYFFFNLPSVELFLVEMLGLALFDTIFCYIPVLLLFSVCVTTLTSRRMYEKSLNAFADAV